ncbi:hypothetical protein QFC21_005203 [Naganishia friedmannii]|uniref:Uncharacterized protein n=1 Tax=Naganishia friedmannii TaxID=89922 RepID=A0ACC2VBD3_9TREE|nr:hypothetical protein QFC21_005203 [Naganishia friedmannii]
MAPDKLYPYNWQIDANVYFDDSKALSDVEIHSVHMHILFFVSLHKRLKVRGKSVINDRQAALANTTLLSLSRLINNPAQLLSSCLPTCERGSSQTCTNYDVRDHAVYKSAKQLVAAATGGVWDLVLELRKDTGDDEGDRRRRGIFNGESDDDDDDEVEEDIMAVASRNTNGRSSDRKRGRGRGAIRIKKEKPTKSNDDDRSERGYSPPAPSSSPLTEADEDEEEEDEEAVDKNAWLLIDWTIDLWTRSRADSKDPYNDHFLRQLPSSGGPGPRYSIARPMIVVRSAIKSATSAKDVYADPIQVGSKLLSLLYGYTKLHPPGIDPETLFAAVVRELDDLDNSEGLHRLERYYEMLQSATDIDYVNRALAHALFRATTTENTNAKSFAHPGSHAPTLSDVLEWLPAARLSEKRPRGVPLPAHEEKYTCVKSYLLVNVMSAATESDLREWPLDRRRDAINKVFAGTDAGRDLKHRHSSLMLLPDETECAPNEYKALVVAVNENL